MNLSQTPDGIPVIELTAADLAGPQPVGFTAALDQLAAAGAAGLPAFIEGRARADLDAYTADDPKSPGYADRLTDLADGRD